MKHGFPYRAQRTRIARGVVGAAHFSPCRSFRYWLSRSWAYERMGIVIGINPSGADGDYEDQTTLVLNGFARRWGWCGYVLINPFALCATDQSALLTAPDPVGPDNDRQLAQVLAAPRRTIVCAWGGAKTKAVRELLHQRLTVLAPKLSALELFCLGCTRSGAPRHPLRLSYDTPLQRFYIYRPMK